MANGIEIYKTTEGKTQIEVKFEAETVWLSQKQLSVLFSKNVMTINEHIRNVYAEKELDKKSTIRKSLIVQKEGKRQVTREVVLYNLDVIISVGYRVKSKQGTQFRQWAMQRIKEYLIQGYSINEKRLNEAESKFKQLKRTIKLLDNVVKSTGISESEAEGLFTVLNDFTFALDVLDQYDHQTLKIRKSRGKELFRISYQEAKIAIEGLKKKFGGSALFGNEKDKSFKSSLESIYQTFDGKELYSSLEEKATHLLYFVTKNHSFTDGNKRIAAFLFVWFLERNKLLYDEGKKIIDDNALVALTLLIAESKPEDRDMMVKVVVNLIQHRN